MQCQRRSEMTKAKTIGILAAVVLSLGLARPDRAVAAEVTVAAPTPDGAQATVSSLDGLFADLSAGMSLVPQAPPVGPGAPMMSCDLVCCFELPPPFDYVTICCVFGSCRVV